MALDKECIPLAFVLRSEGDLITGLICRFQGWLRGYALPPNGFPLTPMRRNRTDW